MPHHARRQVDIKRDTEQRICKRMTVEQRSKLVIERIFLAITGDDVTDV